MENAELRMENSNWKLDIGKKEIEEWRISHFDFFEDLIMATRMLKILLTSGCKYVILFIINMIKN